MLLFPALSIHHIWHWISVIKSLVVHGPADHDSFPYPRKSFESRSLSRTYQMPSVYKHKRFSCPDMTVSLDVSEQFFNDQTICLIINITHSTLVEIFKCHFGFYFPVSCKLFLKTFKWSNEQRKKSGKAVQAHFTAKRTVVIGIQFHSVDFH